MSIGPTSALAHKPASINKSNDGEPRYFNPSIVKGTREQISTREQTPLNLESKQLPIKPELKLKPVVFDEHSKLDFENLDVKLPVRQVLVSSEEQQPTVRVTCNCAKTSCLKMYCLCFRQGLKCSVDCSCTTCCNDGNHKIKVDSAREQISKRNPLAFKDKLSLGKHNKGCSCRKSGC